MIELVLVFLLGLLAAGLLWLLLLSAVWRRAERLTQERIERALPLDTNEILAERDRERASTMVQRLALDARIEALQGDIVKAKSEVGHQVVREAEMLARLAEFDAKQTRLETQLSALEAQSAERGATIARLTQEGEEALDYIKRLEAEAFALKARLAQAQLQAEQEQRLRDEAEVHLQSARAAEGEARARALVLREELLARQHEARESERSHVG